MSGAWGSRAVYNLALILVIAGLTHLVAVLMIPGRSTASAYRSLDATLGGTTLKTLTTDDPSNPYADPALPRAACLYDLRHGAISASLAIKDDAFAALSVHDRHGHVLAGLTSRSVQNGRLDLTVTSATEPARHTTADDATTELRVEAAEPLGFVLAEVLAAEPSEHAGAAATVAALSCRRGDP